MTGSPKSRASNLVSLELPGPRAQAWPAEGKGGSGDENDVNKKKSFRATSFPGALSYPSLAL